MDTTQVCVLVGGTLLASFMKGGMGMGAGIFLQPTLTLVFPPFTALALTAPILLFTDLFSQIYYWREWAKGPLFVRVLICSAVGAILGVALLPFVSVTLMKILVGCLGGAYSLAKLFPAMPPFKLLRGMLPAPKADAGHASLYLYTTAGGVLNSLANAGGIFYVIYLLSLGLEKRAFVATLVSAILVTSVFKVSGYYLIGILPSSDLVMTAALSPLVAAGCWLGSRCNRYLNPEIFTKCIFGLILCVSVKILLDI